MNFQKCKWESCGSEGRGCRGLKASTRPLMHSPPREHGLSTWKRRWIPVRSRYLSRVHLREVHRLGKRPHGRSAASFLHRPFHMVMKSWGTFLNQIWEGALAACWQSSCVDPFMKGACNFRASIMLCYCVEVAGMCKVRAGGEEFGHTETSQSQASEIHIDLAQGKIFRGDSRTCQVEFDSIQEHV